ncbi:hypothetical protein FQ154_01765 [Paeniglutamicibacter gangotriensis]|uniref:Uncharacterized protein n=1 Tax=Paeniglutamicibacter gangotriensis TaxID=254787 RepID=A0A5B0ENA7_9MICC|nr:hypothetical protein [Paeniglutamicibacter gangotriensis]KAA0979912.1 hypothetical protein FQ154_01765 [Paeniglutamicibacter gangotriensis]
MKPEYEYRPGPRNTRERNDYSHLAAHLRANPGVWVKVRTAPTIGAAGAAAHQIRAGKRVAFRPAAEYEAYSHGLEVIARYVGACHVSPLPPGGYCTACGTVDVGVN